MIRKRLAALSGLAAAGLALSGCGSIGIHPGSAAVIGGRTISMRTINTSTTLFCKVYVAQSQSSQQQQSGPVPMTLLRSYAASSLAKRALGQQLADQYGVQPASGYDSYVAQLQQALSATSTPADQTDAAIAVAGADAYLKNVQVAIGEQLSGNTGQTNADVNAALARGQVATTDWLKDHKAYVDPVFGLAVDGGSFTAKSDQTSYPVSALASQGTQLSGQSGPPAAYTAALPAAQRCG